jgi:hypothetical protein
MVLEKIRWVSLPFIVATWDRALWEISSVRTNHPLFNYGQADGIDKDHWLINTVFTSELILIRFRVVKKRIF